MLGNFLLLSIYKAVPIQAATKKFITPDNRVDSCYQIPCGIRLQNITAGSEPPRSFHDIGIMFHGYEHYFCARCNPADPSTGL